MTLSVPFVRVVAAAALATATLVGAVPAASAQAGPAGAALTEAEAVRGKPQLLGSAEDGAAFEGAGSAAGFRTEAVSGQPFETAYVAAVERPTDPVWGVTLTSPAIEEPVERGDVLLGVFHSRAEFEAGDQNESGTGEFNAFLQRGEGEWASLVNLGGRPTTQWRQRYFTATAAEDFNPGTVNFVFHLGGKKQTFSVGGFRLWNLGPEADPATLPSTSLHYPGREADAPWRAEAQERIEDFRKSELIVRVVDESGNPVEGAEVLIELADLAFGVGTFLGSNPPAMHDTPDGEEGREVLGLFNRLTVPVYGADWGWQDLAMRGDYFRTMAFAEELGHPIRAHVLVWPGWRWSPAAWKKLADDGSADELRETVNQHVREVAGYLSGHDVDVVDVFNEPRSNHDVDDAVGHPSPRPDWFRITREVAPGIRLAINEFGIVSGYGTQEANIQGYIDAVRELIDAGVPLDVIGVQGHMGEAFTAPEQLWKVFDRLAVFGLPIHVTEFDVATDDEQVQADYTRDFLQASFAHPAVEQVTLWGYWEANHWIPKAALWDEDWEPYPAGMALRELIEKTWHTSAKRTTGDDGSASVDGFHGTYRIEVARGGVTAAATAELVEGGSVATVTLD